MGIMNSGSNILMVWSRNWKVLIVLFLTVSGCNRQNSAKSSTDLRYTIVGNNKLLKNKVLLTGNFLTITNDSVKISTLERREIYTAPLINGNKFELNGDLWTIEFVTTKQEIESNWSIDESLVFVHDFSHLGEVSGIDQIIGHELIIRSEDDEGNMLAIVDFDTDENENTSDLHQSSCLLMRYVDKKGQELYTRRLDNFAIHHQGSLIFTFNRPKENETVYVYVGGEVQDTLNGYWLSSNSLAGWDNEVDIHTNPIEAVSEFELDTIYGASEKLVLKDRI